MEHAFSGHIASVKEVYVSNLQPSSNETVVDSEQTFEIIHRMSNVMNSQRIFIICYISNISLTPPLKKTPPPKKKEQTNKQKTSNQFNKRTRGQGSYGSSDEQWSDSNSFQIQHKKYKNKTKQNMCINE